MFPGKTPFFCAKSPDRQGKDRLQYRNCFQQAMSFAKIYMAVIP